MDAAKRKVVFRVIKQFAEAMNEFQPQWEQDLGEMEHAVYHEMLLRQVDVSLDDASNKWETPGEFQDAMRADIEDVCAALQVNRVRLCDAQGRHRHHAVDLNDPLGHAATWLHPDKPSLYEAVMCCQREEEASTRTPTLLEIIRRSERDAKLSTVAEQSDLVYITHMAHRGLVLSEYFPKWKGSTRQDWQVFAHHRVVSLGQVLRLCENGRIAEDSFLGISLRYHLLCAFRDWSSQCLFDSASEVTVDNVFWDKKSGRLLLGQVEWKAPDNPYSVEWTRAREVALLQAYGKIVERSFCGVEDAQLVSVDADESDSLLHAKVGDTLVFRSERHASPTETSGVPKWFLEDQKGTVEVQGSNRFYLREPANVVFRREDEYSNRRVRVIVEAKAKADLLSPETRVLVEACKHAQRGIALGTIRTYLGYRPLLQGKSVDLQAVLMELRDILR